MLNRERNNQISRINDKLQLQGYNKTYKNIIDSWDFLRRGGLCFYTQEEANLIVEKGKSCEIAILDTLYYQGVRLNIFKKFRVYIKNKIQSHKSRKNYKSLEIDKKTSLSDFLKLIGKNKIKNRKIKF